MTVPVWSKITASAIVTDFLNNVVTTVFSGAYDVNNIPYFFGTTYRNTSNAVNDNIVAFTNPSALPSSDLDSYSNAYPSVAIGNPGEKITGATVYGALLGVVSGLTRVRNFTSYWYHQNNSSFSLVSSIGGKAIFKSSLAALPAYSGVGSTAVSGWERTPNTSLQALAVDGTAISSGHIASAASINQFFTNLKNAWGTVAANAIQYKFYTCHRNCHSNCHGSRGRR
jgi:hypothetical protein